MLRVTNFHKFKMLNLVILKSGQEIFPIVLAIFINKNVGVCQVPLNILTTKK